MRLSLRCIVRLITLCRAAFPSQIISSFRVVSSARMLAWQFVGWLVSNGEARSVPMPRQLPLKSVSLAAAAPAEVTNRKTTNVAAPPADIYRITVTTFLPFSNLVSEATRS